MWGTLISWPLVPRHAKLRASRSRPVPYLNPPIAEQGGATRPQSKLLPEPTIFVQLRETRPYSSGGSEADAMLDTMVGESSAGAPPLFQAS